MRNIVVLHIAALSFNKASGLTTSVPALVTAQNNISNVTAGLVISKGEKPEDWNPAFSVFQYKNDFFQPSLNDLPEPYNQPDLVIFHSTYIPINAKISRKISARKIPYILVPRGGMTVNSQLIKPFKKKIGNKLFFNRMVKRAAAIHCLTEGEDNESRQWGKDTFIVGNGMNLPENCTKKVYMQEKQFIFTFIGRLDIYHKGLDLLLEGCGIASKRSRIENIRINIYGPDKQDNVRLLNQKIKEQGLDKIVKIFPPVFGNEKEYVLKNTDIFVHTSRFEGHPMSVLEALSYGIPCLLTPGTNISKEVENANAGWEIEQNSESIAEGIIKILESKDDFNKMSVNAKDLIRDNYSWEEVGSKTINAYLTVLKK